MDRTVKKYAAIYRAAIRQSNLPDVGAKTQAYAEKLTQMYASPAYREHSVYPTMSTERVYAVIAMCLMLKSYGFDSKQIIDIVDGGFENRRRMFKRLEKIIDLFPCAWQIVRRWNISDHEGRVKDGSITYDYFNVTDDSVSYKISHCMYAEMFGRYGIRECCKIFCMTDVMAYSNLTRHVNFIRHSDLSDGDCCQDEVLKK